MKRKKYKDINYLNFNIKNKPKIEDYNITQEMLNIEIAKYEEKKRRLLKRKAKQDKPKLWLWWLIPTIIITIYYLYEVNYHWLVSILIGCMCGSSGIVVFAFINAFTNIQLKDMEQISIDGNRVLDRYKRYKHDLSCYETELNRRTQIKKEEYWTKMDGHKFEHEIAKLYSQHGFSTQVTKGSGDGGIDIIMTKNKITYYVQCKNHSKPISPATARDLYGAMTSAGVKNGIIVSPRGFSDNVRKFVSDKNITLVDIEEILKMSEQLD